jgi:phosphinothricin acetyltransferase
LEVRAVPRRATGRSEQDYVSIRLATTADAGAIQAIYAPYVRDTAVSFETEPPTPEEIARRIASVSRSLPWLICEDAAGAVIGYAYASKHRERAAYDWSVDVAIYVQPSLHQRGVGRALYTSLFQLLRLLGYHRAFAGITLPNDASVGLHTAMGFQPVGVYQDVGFKLGRWHDVAWYGLTLRLTDASPRPLRLPSELAGDPAWIAAVKAGQPLLRLSTATA